MLERRRERLAPISVFVKRMTASLLLAGGLALLALAAGAAGYHWSAGFGWFDSLMEASMILGGMGPVRSNEISAAPGYAKVFISGYALVCGLVFIAVMGIILTPITHRMLHKFHLDERDME